MTSIKASPKIIVLFLSLLLLVAVVFIIQPDNTQKVPKDLIAVLRPQAIPLQLFTLVDHNGHIFTKDNLNTKWSFIFFGYTNCPDICPTTLFTLKQISKALEKHPQAASDMQVVFVSIDPERDTPKSLAKYITYFNKDFIAVTGLPENLKHFSKQFAAAYIKEAADTSGDYLMSHTSSVFLVNPKTRLVASFSPPHDTETITSQYLKIHDLF